MINKEKIKAKVKKAIKKLPTTGYVKRAYLNDFEEKTDLLDDICTLEGLYHEGSNISISLQDKGEIKSDKGLYFLIVCDETAKLIRKDDYLILGNTKYLIKDLGNVNKMDIYMDMKLQEVCEIEQ